MTAALKDKPRPVYLYKDVEEEWRAVQGWEGYYMVSSWGRVKSLPRNIITQFRYWGNGRKRKLSEKIMFPSPMIKADGTIVFRLTFMIREEGKQNKTESWNLAKLIATVFIGPAPSEKSNVGFKDSNCSNLHYTNLYWID